MEVVENRRKYYHHLMTAVLRSLGVDPSKIRFVAESSFAYRKEYFVDVLRTCALMTQQDAKDTCEETAETKMLSPLLCCVYQSLSEQYLDIDIQFGGEDQVCKICSQQTCLYSTLFTFSVDYSSTQSNTCLCLVTGSASIS
jgi:tyrosyl-tRNA synthetase